MSYVANLKIERVETGMPTQGKRCVSESLNLTVRSETLNGLKEKVIAHINLIDKEDIQND